MNKSTCDGCRSTISSEDQIPLCLVYYVRDKLGGCPCMECLIKSMCSRMCDERMQFFEDISKRYMSEVNKAYDEREKKLE
jgi:hypothetical protein